MIFFIFIFLQPNTGHRSMPPSSSPPSEANLCKRRAKEGKTADAARRPCRFGGRAARGL